MSGCVEYVAGYPVRGVATRTHGSTCVPEKVEKKIKQNKTKKANKLKIITLKMHNLSQVIFSACFFEMMFMKQRTVFYTQMSVSKEKRRDSLVDRIVQKKMGK